MKYLLAIIVVLALATVSFAADVSMKWDAVPGATGYKIYMSLDNCVTWPTVKDVGNVTTYVWIGAPDNVMVHFKGSAYKTGTETIVPHFGAWWDSRLAPLPMPVGLGVR